MQAVLRMLEEIGCKEEIPKALERAKNKQDPFRLMGFGHRVYKTFDPRAKVMRKVCHEILDHLNIQYALGLVRHKYDWHLSCMECSCTSSRKLS